MGCDLVVAVGPATVDGHTLFGQNVTGRGDESVALCREPGRDFVPGEKIQTQHVELPQARQTYTVLAGRSPRNWGYHHGLNEQGVAAGCAGLQNKLRPAKPGLTGSDLVRLILERSRTARQGMDVVADLLERYGQGVPDPADDGATDTALVIADGTGAFVVETAANHWVYQEILEVRAVSNLSTIRQDWDRISHGLAGSAIAQGWWPADGTKLDFATALSASPTGAASALRRWGRATLLLEQQNGHIDGGFVRRLLSDHYEGTHFEVDPFTPGDGPAPLCEHASRTGHAGTAAGFLTRIARDAGRLPVVECAFGPPCLGVHFPVFLDGELPFEFSAAGAPVGGRVRQIEELLRTEPEQANQVRDRLARLQVEIDQEADEFATGGAALKQSGEAARLHQSATVLMRNFVEQFNALFAELHIAPSPQRHAVGTGG
jgi:hypothetical protein